MWVVCSSDTDGGPFAGKAKRPPAWPPFPRDDGAVARVKGGHAGVVVVDPERGSRSKRDPPRILRVGIGEGSPTADVGVQVRDRKGDALRPGIDAGSAEAKPEQ